MLTFNQHNNNNKRQSFFEKRTFKTGSGPLLPLFLPIPKPKDPTPSGNRDSFKNCHLMKKAFKDSILALANYLTLHEEFNPKASFDYLIYKADYKQALSSSDLDIFAIMYAATNVSNRIEAGNQSPLNPMYPEDMPVRVFLKGLVALKVFNRNVLAVNFSTERIANGYAFISKFIGGEHIKALKQFTKNNEAITNVEKNQLAILVYFLDEVTQLTDLKNKKDFATHVLDFIFNPKLSLVVALQETLDEMFYNPRFPSSFKCCLDRLKNVGKYNVNLADVQKAFFEYIANPDTKKSLLYRTRVARELLQYKIARLKGKKMTDQEFDSYSSTTKYILENAEADKYREIDKEIAKEIAASTTLHKRVRSYPFCNSCTVRAANEKNVNVDLEPLLKPLVDHIAAFLKLNFTGSDEKSQCSLTLKRDEYQNRFVSDVMVNIFKDYTPKPKDSTPKPKDSTPKPKDSTPK